MKYPLWLIIVVLALVIALAWCLFWRECEHTTTPTLSLRVDADGMIDRSHHVDASLFHDESMRWVCENCPDGVEFGVTDIFYLAELDRAAEGLHWIYAVEAEGAAGSRLSTAQERARGLEMSLAPDAEAGEGEAPLAVELPREQMALGLGEIGEVLEVLAGIARLDGEPGPFPGWVPPPPGSEPVVSPPYTQRGDYLCKFTWVTYKDGREVDRWDPHFPAHERKR